MEDNFMVPINMKKSPRSTDKLFNTTDPMVVELRTLLFTPNIFYGREREDRPSRMRLPLGMRSHPILTHPIISTFPLFHFFFLQILRVR
jgi:hypothetical protein